VFLVSQIAYVDHFAGDLEGLGMFWLISGNVVQVGSMLLLALVITENTAPQPAAPSARRYARSPEPAGLLSRQAGDDTRPQGARSLPDIQYDEVPLSVRRRGAGVRWPRLPAPYAS
jgi:hypothetical protein